MPKGTPDARRLPNTAIGHEENQPMGLRIAAGRRGLLLLCLLSPAGATNAVEALDYRVVYRGVFSAGSELPIADLRLDEALSADGVGLNRTRIEVNSHAYPLIESLFPIRYRWRSWSRADNGGLVGFETYESMGKKRHRLYLRDDSHSGVRRYDLLQGNGQQELGRLEAGLSSLQTRTGKGPVDRLGLLQQVRGKALAENANYRFEVTDGRDLLIYEVSVVAAQSLNIAGTELPAWKLRFDGMERGRQGKLEAAHRPVYAWLSRAAGHVPLRVESRHPIGRFRVELKQGPAMERVARAGP